MSNVRWEATDGAEVPVVGRPQDAVSDFRVCRVEMLSSSCAHRGETVIVVSAAMQSLRSPRACSLYSSCRIHFAETDASQTILPAIVPFSRHRQHFDAVLEWAVFRVNGGGRIPIVAV